MASLTKLVLQLCLGQSHSIFIRNLCITIASINIIFSTASFAIQPIADISQTPLELTPTVIPNVMILLDDSGSMDFEIMTADANSSGLFFAPNPDGTNYGSSDADLTIKQRAGCELVTAAFGGYAYGIASSLNQYVPDASYGADKAKCYVADEQAWRFRCSSFNKLYYDPSVIYQPWPGLRADGTPFTDAPINAAPLDPFLTNSPTVDIESPDASQTGIDAFRYHTCEPDSNGNFFLVSQVTLDESTSTTEKQNFANWFSYHRSRHLRAKALLGEFIINQTNTRIGITKVNTNSLSLEVEEMNASFEDDGAKRNLLNALYSSSPSQVASRFDTRYIQTARYLRCRNTSIFSDEECPAEDAPAGTCQANHIILASDGFIDEAIELGTNSVGNEDADSSGNDFDGGPFVDAASEVEVGDSDYRTMSDITMRFYKRDLHSGSPVNLADQVEPTEVDRNRYPTLDSDPLEADETIHQHIKTHVVIFDVPLQAAEEDRLRFPGTISGTETFEPFDWLNPIESDIGLLQNLYHAAYSGRGDVVSATEKDPITNNSNNGAVTLINNVAQGVGSTTPIAINTQGTSSNLVIYRTFYDSSSNSGDLVAQEITINTDGNLNIESSSNPDFIWSAAQKLDQLVELSISNRNVISYSNVSNDGINFDFDDLDSSQRTQLETPIPSSIPNTLDITKERINYLIGDTTREGIGFDIGQFRIRPEVDSTGGGIIHNAKLGTIANSTPVFVGQPQAIGRFGGAWPSEDGKTYFDFQTNPNILSRAPSLVVGANDGMLHVFNADTGIETYAYVPSIVYDNLSSLTFPEYKHRFFVDGTPVTEDIFSTSDDQWKTVVIGGLGAGGRGYYALDITDSDSSVNVEDRVLWEFGPEDDPDSYIDNGNLISDLGLTFGEPVIAMSNVDDGSNKKWVAIFGNGYNSTSVNGEAVIYILFIDQGIDGEWSEVTNDVIKINLGQGGGASPNGIAGVRAIDRFGDGTVDYLYVGDLYGNLHVVDITSDDADDWANSNSNYILFEAEYNGNSQPITTKPIVVSNDGGTSDDVIVIFATGSYFTKSDAIDTDIQSLYGIVHDFNPNNAPVNKNLLTKQTLSNAQFTDPDTGNVIDVRIFSDSPQTTGDDGWYINFDVPPLGASPSSSAEFPGEKAVRELQLRSGVLFVNTIIPQPLSCDPAPGGFSLAIDPQSGTAGEEPIFDINNDSEFNDEDSIQLTSGGSYKVIVGTRFDSTPADSTFFGDYRITQLSDTNIDAILTNTAKTELVGRQTWREVEF